jgi:tetratricopeptide (TPR) repeat protein
MLLVVEQDPLNAPYRAILASHLAHARLYDEALVEVQRAFEIDPAIFAAGISLVEAFHGQGNVERAAAAAEQAHEAVPWNESIRGLFAGLLAQVGQAQRGEELMRQLGNEPADPFSRVFFHLLRSEIDLAADWYEKSIAQRALFAIIFAPAPMMVPLRESGRWPRLAQLMNLPV